MSFVEEIKYDLCLPMFADDADDDQNAKYSNNMNFCRELNTIQTLKTSYFLTYIIPNNYTINVNVCKNSLYILMVMLSPVHAWAMLMI